MRDLDECKAEILRRSREKIARRKRRRCLLMGILPLCLTAAVGTAVLLRAAQAEGNKAETLPDSKPAGVTGEIAPQPDMNRTETPPDRGTPEMTEEIAPFPDDNRAETAEPPEDFAFSLTFGVGGESRYDSATGQLVKHAADAGGSSAVCRLAEAQRRTVYAAIAQLHIDSYPDRYDPQNGTLGSDPSMTLILSVTADGAVKTVRAEHIALTFTADNEKGQAFLDVCRSIRDMLTETDAWKALPDKEPVD